MKYSVYNGDGFPIGDEIESEDLVAAAKFAAQRFLSAGIDVERVQIFLQKDYFEGAADEVYISLTNNQSFRVKAI